MSPSAKQRVTGIGKEKVNSKITFAYTFKLDYAMPSIRPT